MPPAPRASLCGEHPGPGGRRAGGICVCRALSGARSGRARLSCTSGRVARSPDARQDLVLLSGTDTPQVPLLSPPRCPPGCALLRCAVRGASDRQAWVLVLARLGLSLRFLIGSCKAIVTIPSGVILVWLVTAAAAVTSLGSLGFSSPSVFSPLGIWRTYFSSSGFWFSFPPHPVPLPCQLLAPLCLGFKGARLPPALRAAPMTLGVVGDSCCQHLEGRGQGSPPFLAQSTWELRDFSSPPPWQLQLGPFLWVA